MTATLRWNRLVIEANGDDDLKKAVKSELKQWVKSPFHELELDLGGCSEIGEAGFKVLGSELVDISGSRNLTVRINPALTGLFEGSGLAGLVRVQVIERMDGAAKQAPAATELEPVDDDAEDVKEETHPPSGDTNITRIQTRAQNGKLVDDEDGTSYPVDEQLVIGREPPSHPVFAIPTISKAHFRIYRQGPGYFIEDLRSTNGTYLNGNPLTQPQPLAEGDEIVVAITLKHPEGARRFKFTMK